MVAGKHKGAKGKVMQIIDERVIVDGVNKAKFHIKAKSKNEKGSIIEREASLHVSNVMIVDSKTGKGSRVGKKKVGDKIVRVTKKSGEELK